MATDALLTLAAKATVTATTHGTGVSLPKSAHIRPFWIRFIYSAATQASGSGVWTFGCSVSYDAGNTWNADWIAADEIVTLTTTAQQGEFFIPVTINQQALILPGVIADATHAVQLRADAVLSGSPVTPTITWGAEFAQARQ